MGYLLMFTTEPIVYHLYRLHAKPVKFKPVRKIKKITQY